jgi:hypothetical protein
MMSRVSLHSGPTRIANVLNTSQRLIASDAIVCQILSRVLNSIVIYE